MSNSEYPKALYRGDQNKNEHTIADDYDHEEFLLEKGWVAFSDLPEQAQDQSVASETAQGDGAELTSVKAELLVALKAQEELQEQLQTAHGEFIAFQNNLAAMYARIAELHGDTTPVGATSENPNPTEAQDHTDQSQTDTDYSSWTADQLRDAITNQGKKFKARDSKDELIEILKGE